MTFIRSVSARVREVNPPRVLRYVLVFSVGAIVAFGSLAYQLDKSGWAGRFGSVRFVEFVHKDCGYRFLYPQDYIVQHVRQNPDSASNMSTVAGHSSCNLNLYPPSRVLEKGWGDGLSTYQKIHGVSSHLFHDPTEITFYLNGYQLKEFFFYVKDACPTVAECQDECIAEYDAFVKNFSWIKSHVHLPKENRQICMAEIDITNIQEIERVYRDIWGIIPAKKVDGSGFSAILYMDTPEYTYFIQRNNAIIKIRSNAIAQEEFKQITASLDLVSNIY